MIIHLTKDLEQFVHDAVRAGLYAREDDVIRDALIRLNQTMPEAGRTTNPSVGLTEEEAADQQIQRQFFDAGLGYNACPIPPS